MTLFILYNSSDTNALYPFKKVNSAPFPQCTIRSVIA